MHDDALTFAHDGRLDAVPTLCKVWLAPRYYFRLRIVSSPSFALSPFVLCFSTHSRYYLFIYTFRVPWSKQGGNADLDGRPCFMRKERKNFCEVHDTIKEATPAPSAPIVCGYQRKDGSDNAGEFRVAGPV